MSVVKSIVLCLSLVLLVLLGLSWAPDVPVSELKQRWAAPPSQFIDVNGLAVHVRDEGPRDDTTPIFLLHGTSASLHTWDGWTAALKGTRRVIRVDMPGFGLTGPARDGDYHMARYVAFVVGVLEHFQLNSVVLAGNSLGGQIAWETALAHPDRVSQLILVDAAGLPLQSTSVPIGFRLARTPALAPLVTKLLPRQMIESSVRNVYGNPDLVNSALVDRYYDLTRRQGNRAALIERFQQSDDGTKNAERIALVSVPTLILWGGRDRLIAPLNGQRFASAIQGSKLVMFDSLGHVPQEEDPANTVAAVLAFLDFY